MEVLVLDGKSYVKAAKAAKDLGYASDYVGQLCRKGQVDARLIGRTWYVDAEQLGSHRVEKKRMSRIKAREQAKKAISEVREEKGAEAQDTYRNINIRYESDERDLIPQTRKLGVESVGLEPGQYERPEPEYDSETVIQNKGEKVLMSGTVEVVDVTDAPLDSDTVILTPRKIRRGQRMEISPKRLIPVSIEENTAPEEVKPRSFINKLEAATAIPVVEEEKDPQPVVTPPEALLPKPSLFFPVFAMFSTLLFVIATIPLYQTLSYYGGESPHIVRAYDYSVESAVAKIKLIIYTYRVNDL